MAWLCALVCIAASICLTCSLSEPSVFYVVEEEQPIGTIVGEIRKDAPLDVEFNERDLRSVTFHFLTPRPTMIQVDANSGQVRTAERLDRETLCPGLATCALNAELAVQGANNFKVVIIKVVISILDINDNAPVFPVPKVTLAVTEAAALGTTLTLPSASDADTVQFGVKDYSMTTTSSHGAFFELLVTRKNDQSTEVKLVLKRSLDRELMSECTIKLMVRDGGLPSLSGTLEITVEVKDANDHSPAFEQSFYRSHIVENVPILTSILRVVATDKDTGANGRIVYALSEQTQKSFGKTFAIDNSTGMLYNLLSLDYETTSSYSLYVKAFDLGSEPMTSEVLVTIDVDDINDNAPEITVSALHTSADGEIVEVPENMAPGGFVAQVIVVDRDKTGDNGRVNCTMNDPSFRFTLRSSGKYQVVTTTVLDRERRDAYNLRVVCQDRGSPPLSSVKDISIVITDDNDNSPVFEKASYEATMFERNYEGANILRVNATDADAGRNGDVTYSLSESAAGSFQIDQHTGVIRAVTSIDREKTPRLTFSVIATDSGGVEGANARSSTAHVNVFVQDVNDEKPQFTLPAYYFTAVENAKPGKAIGNVSAFDADGDAHNSMVTYSLVLTGSSVGLFAIDAVTGTISLVRSPDRELASVHYFTAVAKDAGSPPLSGTTPVSVTISDVNDNAPSFRFPSGINSSLVIPNNHPPGYVITRIDAVDTDLGINAEIRYSISGGNEHDYFSVDNEYGALIVNVDLSQIVYETVTLEIVAKDRGQPSLSTKAVLVVIVNKSLATSTTSSSDAMNMLLAGHNLTVVLALVALTVVVLLLLVTTIACLKRHDSRRRKSSRYNCRIETIKAFTTAGSGGGGSAASLKRDGVCAGDGAVPHHHHAMRPADGVCDRLLMEQRCTGDCCDDGGFLKASDAGLLKQEPIFYSSYNCYESEHEIYLMEQLRHNAAADDVSLHSADGSNTDSGRGPSETGDVLQRAAAAAASAAAAAALTGFGADRAPADPAERPNGAAQGSRDCDDASPAIPTSPSFAAMDGTLFTGVATNVGYGQMCGSTFRPSTAAARCCSPVVPAHQLAARQIPASRNVTTSATKPRTLSSDSNAAFPPPQMTSAHHRGPVRHYTQQPVNETRQQNHLPSLQQQAKPISNHQSKANCAPVNSKSRTRPSPIVERDEMSSSAAATSHC